MPTRLLREGILTSDRVDEIAGDPAAEVFYRRLMSVVDDFGRFSAHPSILRSALYPLRVDTITGEQIAAHLEACAQAGLVSVYTVEGKPYLELADFRQRTRAKSSKYPSPAEDGEQADDSLVTDNRQARGWRAAVTRQADDRHAAVNRPSSDSPPRAETETETETETLASLAACATRAGAWDQSGSLREFLEAYPKHTKRDAAARAYLSVIDSKTKHGELMDGLARWKESDTWQRSRRDDGGRFVPDPDKFIFERRYLDDPAPFRESAGTGTAAIDEALEWFGQKEAA